MIAATLIVNQLAPGANRIDWFQVARDALGPRARLIAVRASGFDEVAGAAAEAAERGDDLLLVAGGDGTVNTCVNAIGPSDIRLVVVPAGTANDLARSIGQSIDGRALDGLVSWQTREIDAITVNGNRFYTVGGPGWAADVAHTANRWRSSKLARRLLRLLGPRLYTLACVVVILFSRRLGSRLAVDYVDADDGRRKRLELDAYGIVVANTDRVGESFYLTPQSRCDDGKFELILFPRRGRLRLLRAVMLMKKNRLFELPEITALQVTSARVVADDSLRFFGEGETLLEAASFELAVADTPVRLLAPAH